ncbi:cysteine-rich protein 2-binding protein isoform X1 [Phlebotomus argentipes]|uniref:cysteine-rich protein 2-binding protein isoform X1 n=1 Tax=Phlebotomus argentipes TaxID=94469 RepID=UPI002893028B|nr:cysteine-rich protein 2-binding protein isoform X1 [Phlebotomus argentipes]
MPPIDPCTKCQQSVIDSEWLKCERCERSIHKQCLEFGTPGDFHGDVFFDMICSQCNFPQNKDIFTRRKLPWIMVLVLVIHNLTITSPGLGNYGYYHYKIHISNFVAKNWVYFFPPDFKRKKNWVGSVAGTLSHFNRLFFQSGTDELGSNGWWKLTRSETPLSYFYHYEEYQKQKQSFMKKAAFSQSLPPPEVSRTVKMEVEEEVEEEMEEVEDEKFPMRNIKTEELIIEDFIDPLSEAFSTEEMPDISSLENLEEDFFFTWEEISEQNDTEETATPATDYKYPFYPSKVPKSLFTASKKPNSPIMKEEENFSEFEETSDMMSEYEEGEMLKQLRDIIKRKAPEDVPEDIRRFYRKLSVRQEKRKFFKPLHNIDTFPESEESKKPRVILDRFHQLTCTGRLSGMEDVKFSTRLVGNVQHELLKSPYTGRLLQPFIYRDSVSLPQWVRVMSELQFTVNDGKIPSRAPIDYCYVRPHHIPAVNSLLQRLFWPTIDMAECLMYPDFSVIALYKQLIVGCAFLVPDVGHNEAYISFMAVRSGWQKAGIGSFMLYHLTQTCPEKDITLHVSATNSAVFLYQKFGFKIEEMILDFYDKYLPWESTESRHAFFLRLRR